MSDIEHSFSRQPAVVLGHSLGAMVATMVAAQRPGRVRAVVLKDPPGTALAERVGQSRFHLQFSNMVGLLATARDAETLTGGLANMEVQRRSDGVVVRFSELRDPNAIHSNQPDKMLALDTHFLESNQLFSPKIQP